MSKTDLVNFCIWVCEVGAQQDSYVDNPVKDDSAIVDMVQSHFGEDENVIIELCCVCLTESESVWVVLSTFAQGKKPTSGCPKGWRFRLLHFQMPIVKAQKAEKISTEQLVGETMDIVAEMLDIIVSRTGMDTNDRGTDWTFADT